MKKVFIVFCLVLLAAGFAAAQVSAGGTLYVAVKNVALKSSTGFFAGSNGSLAYGDRVIVIRVSGRFVEVRSAANASLTGWTASANLSARRIASETTSTVSAREVALAAKGFNQEAENSYRSQQGMNYADVDRTEAITVKEADLRQFLEEGHLSMGDN
jgi:hypothetical protein